MVTKLNCVKFREIEYTYHSSNSGVSFEGARSYCHDKDSNLTYIKDEATWNEMFKYLSKKNISHWWIGLKKKPGVVGSQWEWLDGDKYNLSKTISEKNQSDCGYIRTYESETVNINSMECTNQSQFHNYICQRQISAHPTTAIRLTTSEAPTNTDFKSSERQGITSTTTVPSVLSTPTTTEPRDLSTPTTTVPNDFSTFTTSVPSNYSTSATTIPSNYMYTGIIIAVSVLLLLLVIVFLVWWYKAKRKRNSKPHQDVSLSSCHATSNNEGDHAEINTAQNFEPLHSASAYEGSHYATADDFQREFQEVAQPADNNKPKNSGKCLPSRNYCTVDTHRRLNKLKD